MSRRAFPWSRLGIDPTKDKGAIRKAYADILRATNLDEDIAGYAELRRARDSALWQADQPDREETPALLEEDEGELVGLGSLDDNDWDDDDWDGDDWDGEDYVWDDRPAARHPDPVARSGFGEAPELTEAQQRAQAAWNRMLELLYPEGEASDAAVTHAELDEGLAALEVLIARAEEADLQEHDALDTALADLFARTWPRSAPFVEPANVAFHWLDEAGALEERYSLRFLNDRIKGMRFHEKVQLPAHPLNKAWVELSRPGRASFADRLRVKLLEVHKLLTGIRERYPELEAHLDPERVASWEGGSSGQGGKLTGWQLFRGIALVVFLIIVSRQFGEWVDPYDGGPPAPSAIEQEASAEEIDARVADIFGAGTDMAGVRKSDPVFADQLSLVIRNADAESDTLAFVRNKALQAAEIAKFGDLVRIAELKRLWLAAAIKSPDQCKNVRSGDFASLPLVLGKAEATRERELLERLLHAKLLNHSVTKRGTTFSIPGWTIEKMLKRSGLSIDELSAALKNPGHPKRCLVDLTLAEVVLEEPGRVSADVMRAL